MNGCVYNLSPANVQNFKCDKKVLEGILELEVCLINFITSANSGQLTENDIINQYKEAQIVSYETFLKNVIINNIYKNNLNINEIYKELQSNIQGYDVQKLNNFSGSLQVKIVWCGEHSKEADNISISCKTQKPKEQIEQFKLKTKRKYNPHSNRHNHKQNQKYKHQDQQDIRQYLPLSAKNKLRYRICTNASLFLEYLRSCKSLRIILTGGDSCLLTRGRTLRQVKVSLPLVLLKKFNHNIIKRHNFKYKTKKVHTLYNQNKESVKKTAAKSGEIQLRFKMLFAPTIAASASVIAAATQNTKVLHDKNHYHHQHRHNHFHRLGGKSSRVAEEVQGDIPKRLTSQTKSEEIVEAMKKLDAKLVAYLAGETQISSKVANCEEENKVNLNLENNISNNLEDLLPATRFNIFKRITGIKLEMEALTLQPAGTKYMKITQNEIEPIFTVECQLSNELIKLVPRHDMFHIMQFESEKFQSLTQCTRFAKKAERAVKLDINADWSDENANETIHDFGRLHFTVWWREPGTCLNELLGMGVLEINDLYNASLLEQCKRIEIQRRDRHLACLYFKVTLQRGALKSSTQMKIEEFLPKQISADCDNDKSPTTDKNKNSATGQQQTTAAQCGLQSNAGGNSSNSGTDKASAQNKNVKFQTTNFDDETSKIRLLKGFISANETRDLELSLPSQTFLICRRFWLDEPAAVKGDGNRKFNYQEQFSIINDEKFLQRADKQFLHLELWQRMNCDDGNGNFEENAQPLGVVRMPLHQFFIAYRNAKLTNHLCKGKLPVISIDAWTPVINCQTGLNVGEIKCLLAVGSDEQIKYLKETRGFTVDATSPSDIGEYNDLIAKLQPLQLPSTFSASVPDKQSTASGSSKANNAPLSLTRIKSSSELLDMLQKALKTPPSIAPECQTGQVEPAPTTSQVETKCHSENPSLPIKTSDVKLLKFSLDIQKASGLPLNNALKAKKGHSKRNANKRFPPNEAPNCYVTFQAEEGQYPTYKSHEGNVFATNIVEKSTHPQWHQNFRLAVSIDYLKIPQKLFILKVLKKSSLDMTGGRNLPTPMEDAIIGLTAIDLSAFARGLHIAGTFNIVDFNGHTNGQLMLRCQPSEEIPPLCSGSTKEIPAAACSAASSLDSVIDQFEQTLDLTHLNLGQAIKRKFTELEGISQRLRARLEDVTGSELHEDFDLDAWKPTEIEANDDNELNEFEHDLNTSPINEEETNEEKFYNNKYQGKCETDNVEKSE